MKCPACKITEIQNGQCPLCKFKYLDKKFENEQEYFAWMISEVIPHRDNFVQHDIFLDKTLSPDELLPKISEAWFLETVYKIKISDDWSVPHQNNKSEFMVEFSNNEIIASYFYFTNEATETGMYDTNGVNAKSLLTDFFLKAVYPLDYETKLCPDGGCFEVVVFFKYPYGKFLLSPNSTWHYFERTSIDEITQLPVKGAYELSFIDELCGKWKSKVGCTILGHLVNSKPDNISVEENKLWIDIEDL